MSNDRSDAALRERLMIAEKAAQGPLKLDEVITKRKDFETSYVVKDRDGFTIVDVLPTAAYQANAAHIAASSPDVVRANIEEILRLRAENERLNREADWLAKALGVQVKDGFGCAWCWLSESDMCNGDCTESLRNAASEAVEEEENV